MILAERTRIDATTDDVFRFFEEMEDNYEEWHPDHVTFQWVDGDGLEPGNEAYFEEEIGGELLQRTVRFVAVEDGRYIEMHPTARVTRFFLPSISFTIEPDGDGCRFTQRIRLRIGPIGRWLNRDDLEAVRRHVREEGENLRAILESRA